jgi:hypothetical protein
MHSDLFRLSAMLRGRNIRTTILSTGLLLERNAARIVEVRTSHRLVRRSAGIHDRIRGVPGAFESLAKGVRQVRRLSPVSSAHAAPCRRATPLTCAPRQAARDIGLSSLLPGGGLELGGIQPRDGMVR